MSDTLNKWEAEIDEDNAKCSAHPTCGINHRKNDQFKSLIDLVRKKDSALKASYGFVKAEETKGRNKLTVLQIEEALALTGKLE